MKRWGWILLAFVATILMSQLPASPAPGDRVAYPTRPMHDRLSSSVHGKFSTSMILATYSTNGRMSKEDYRIVRALPIYAETYGAVGDGTFHSISSAGYSTSQAQAKWPDVSITNVSTQSVDWAALQQAIKDAEGSESTLELGGKSYFVTEPLISNEYLIVRGNGKGLSAFSANFDLTTIISNYDGPIWEAPNALLQLRDIAFEYDGTPSSDQIGVLMGSDLSEPHFGGRVDNCRFTNNYIAVKWMNCNLGGIERCTFRNNLYASIWIDNDFSADRNDSTMLFNEFTDEARVSTYHVYIKQGSGWTIQGNKFLIGNHHLYVDIPATLDGSDIYETDFFVVNNSFENCNGQLITMKDNRAVGVEGHLSRVHIHNNQGYTTLNHNLPVNIYNVGELSITGNSFNILVDGAPGTEAIIKLREVHDAVIDGNVLGAATPASYEVAGIDLDPTVTNTIIGKNSTASGVLYIGTPSASLTVADQLIDLKDKQLQISRSVTDNLPVVRVFGYGVGGPLSRTSAAYQLNVARGTSLLPTGVMMNDSLGSFSFRGKHSTDWPAISQVLVGSRAAEDQTATNLGAKFEVETTPIGGGTRILSLVVEPDGVLNIPRVGAGVKFPDSSTQTKAATFSQGVNEVVNKSNGSGGWVATGISIDGLSRMTGLRDITFTGATNPLSFAENSLTSTSTLKLLTALQGKTLNDKFGSLTSTYVPRWNGSSLEDSQVISNSTGLGIGAAAATGGLEVYGASGALASARIYRTDATASNGGSALYLYSNDGAAMSSGDRTSTIVMGGARNATGTLQTGVRIDGYADGNWSDTSTPGRVETYTTPVGSVTPSKRSTMDSTGLVTYSNGGGVPFGHQYSNTSTTVSVASANTWYEMTTNMTAGQLKNVTHGGSHYLVATTAGYYKIDTCAAVGTSVAGDEVALSVLVNGTSSATSHGHATVITATTTSSICSTTILSLAANDQISLGVENHAAGRDITISHAQQSMVYIGSP